MNTTSHDGNGNIVEQTVDNGDGTGTRTVYDGKGNVTSTEQVDGLPIVDIDPPPVQTAEERITELEQALAAVSEDQAGRMMAAEQARRDAYDAVLLGKSKTVSLVDAATKAGSQAFIGALT